MGERQWEEMGGRAGRVRRGKGDGQEGSCWVGMTEENGGWRGPACRLSIEV